MRQGNTEHFQTKVSPALAERIRRAAERAGLKPSQWIRRTIERTLDGLNPQAPLADLIIDDPPKGPRSPGLEAALLSQRFELPHLVQPDGSCAGGCDPDTDNLCSVGPDDHRRTGKRLRP